MRTELQAHFRVVGAKPIAMAGDALRVGPINSSSRDLCEYPDRQANDCFGIVSLKQKLIAQLCKIGFNPFPEPVEYCRIWMPIALV